MHEGEDTLLRPAEQGTVGQEPLVYMLVRAVERRFTGSMLFLQADGARDIVTFRDGAPCRIRTAQRRFPLREVLQRMGVVDPSTLADTQTDAATEWVLHGEVLLRDGWVSEATLNEALEQQLALKLLSLLEHPAATVYAHYPNIDLLFGYGGAQEVRSRPLALVMAALRRGAGDAFMPETWERIRGYPLAVHPEAALSHFGLRRDEADVIAHMRTHNATLGDLTAAFKPRTVQTLVFALSITQSLDWGDGVMPIAPRVAGSPAATSAAAAAPATPDQAPAPPEAKPAALPRRQAPTSPAFLARPGRSMFRGTPQASEPDSADVETFDDGLDDGLFEALEGPMDEGLQAESPQPQEELSSSGLEMLAVETLIRRGDLEAAEQRASRALSADPRLGHTPEYITLTAWIQALRQGPPAQLPDTQHYGVQIDTLSRAISEDAGYVRARYYRGLLYRYSGQNALAIRDFQSVLRASPQHVEAQSELRLLMVRKDKRRMRSTLKKLLFDD